MSNIELPKWNAELERVKSFKTTIILEGNIFDLHAYPNNNEKSTSLELLKLDKYLQRYLSESGYTDIVFYNHLDGFYNEFSQKQFQGYMELAREEITNCSENRYSASLDRAAEMIRVSLENTQRPVAVILDFASRYITSPEYLSEEERHFYTKLLFSSLKPRQVKAQGSNSILYNMLFIIANKINDIPAWFYIDNPHSKIIHITKPDKKIRKRFIDTYSSFFVGNKEFQEEEITKLKDKFVDLTEGFMNIELNELRILCRQEKITLDNFDRAVSLYRYGTRENPWDSLEGHKLNNAEGIIRQRVKGQDAAVIQTLDIIKRAVSGMSGLQHSSSSSKPKGILFFAGPTGTGKTELAKTLASLLFGDESACIRFDMSEYQQSHSDQKLLGAPPGYVGYEAGGQLTNAVKERPFSILLFDEIEKAHPSILDKFLQILEDGRMTDGQGETVYFSESIIIFTSNLGIYTKDQYGNRTPNVTPDMSYNELQENVLQGIKDYFVMELGRPEILNRIGNNFVVFDYIREDVAEQIIESQLSKILVNLKKSKNMEISIEDEARRIISDKAKENMENGGRGIGNIIERFFINPLSRYLFDNHIKNRASVRIKSVIEINSVVTIDCEVNYEI